MTRSAVSPRLLQSLRGIVLSFDAPGAAASAMVGAISEAVASVYGEKGAAQLLYALADSMATRASSDRPAGAREPGR